MIGRPLTGRVPTAVRSALLSNGWEGVSSETAALALEQWGHYCSGLGSGQLEELLRLAPRFGIDLLTGDDWAILTGTRSRLSAFARSWSLPPELAELAIAIGTALPADPAISWRIGSGVIDLSQPVVLERLPADVVTGTATGTGIATATGAATGLLLVPEDPMRALEQFEKALDQLLTAGVDMELVALDPGWSPGRPSLGLHRRFGRPLVCTTDDPLVAVLARQEGAQIFLTSAPLAIQRALDLVSSEQ